MSIRRWVKTYDDIWDEEFFIDNLDLGFFFLKLCTKMQHKDYKTDKGIVPRGSWLVTIQYIADKHKRDRKTITRWLEKLSKAGYISTKTIKGYNSCILITVTNWAKRQDTDGTSSGISVGTSNGISNGTTYKNDKESNRKYIDDTQQDVVNSSDYFGKSSDLRSSESELRNKDLWDQLLSKWVTSEYATSNDKMFNQYWCNMSLENQQDLLCYVNKCTDSNLYKIWKRNILSTKDPLLYLQAELAKLKPKSDNKYRNPGSKPPVMPHVTVDFSSILNPDGTPKKK